MRSRIAAPLTIVRAAGECAGLGIIMRTGEAFQSFGQVRAVLLDRTGTLIAPSPQTDPTSAGPSPWSMTTS